MSGVRTLSSTESAGHGAQRETVVSVTLTRPDFPFSWLQLPLKPADVAVVIMLMVPHQSIRRSYFSKEEIPDLLTAVCMTGMT